MYVLPQLAVLEKVGYEWLGIIFSINPNMDIGSFQ
jgi:hypothetical protein